MTRVYQIILISSLLFTCWLGMQATHELGHVFGAWSTGGHVTRVVLHPLTISRTDVSPNPHPLIVVWAGPVIGVVIPLVLWGVTVLTRVTWVYVLRFFAGFCLLANGLYLSVGSFTRVGDCGDLLRHGSSLWHLWLFGILTVPLGLWLWHRQGSHFGFGAANGQVNRNVAYAMLVVSVGLIVFGLFIGK